MIAGKRIVWRVVDSRLSFVSQTDEWTGTEMVFDVTKKDDRTELRFTHVGLTTEVECYDICSGAWTGIIANNLRRLIAGVGA